MKLVRARTPWFLLTLLAASAVCAQPAQRDCVPLEASEAARVRNILVYSSIPQDDVQKQTMPMLRTIVQPGPGVRGGGLAGAIIGAAIADAIINSQVKRDVERATLAFPQLLDQVKDFDFRREFWARLGASLAQDSRFKTLRIATFDAERGHVEAQDAVNGEPVDAVLELQTHYALSPDLRAFFVTTQALLQSGPDSRELYRCSYQFVTPPLASGPFGEAIAAWAAQEGALYRAAAVIGMEQTLKMLRYDLTGDDAPRPSAAEVSVSTLRVTPGVVVHGPSDAKLVDREDGLVIARDSRGHMRSTMEGETFSPSPEMLAVATRRGEGGGERHSGPVVLEDLLDVMGEPPPAKLSPVSAVPEKGARPQPPPARDTAPRRGAGTEDLDGLFAK